MEGLGGVAGLSWLWQRVGSVRAVMCAGDKYCTLLLDEFSSAWCVLQATMYISSTGCRVCRKTSSVYNQTFQSNFSLFLVFKPVSFNSEQSVFFFFCFLLLPSSKISYYASTLSFLSFFALLFLTRSWYQGRKTTYAVKYNKSNSFIALC